MPNIQTNTIYLNVEGGKTVAFKRVTKYDVKAKLFTIALPDWWAALLNYNLVSGETLDKLEAEWRKAQELFDEKSSHKRKVIIYEFKSSAMLFQLKDGGLVVGGEPHSCSEVEKCLMRTNGNYTKESMSFTQGTALDFWFAIAYEVTSKFEGYETYVTEKGRHIRDNRLAGNKPENKVKAINWTQEREEFFCNFEAELTKLIYKMHTFLLLDPKAVAGLIDKYKFANALPDPTAKE